MNLSRSNTHPLTDDDPVIVAATIGAKSVDWYATGPTHDTENDWRCRKAKHHIHEGNDETCCDFGPGAGHMDYM